MKKLLLLLTAAACLSSARAALNTGTTYNFSTTPAIGEFATAVLNGNAATFGNATAIDGAVQTVSASSNFFKVLPTSTTVPPSAFSGGFRHNNGTGLYIQSRPTTDSTNAANILLATIQNATAGTITDLTVSYDFNTFNPTTAELPGFRVYWSLTGAPGTWTLIPSLSDIETVGNHTASIPVGTFASGATMYMLWADDNSSATDPSYTIDNFLAVGGSLPMSLTLTAPTNSILISPANVTLSATSGGTTPATTVSFYTNGVLATTDTTAPFSASLTLPDGIYQVHAVGNNGGVDPDVTTPNVVVVVRSEYVNYSSGQYIESFDAMSTSPLITPQGWWVGAQPAGTAQFVTVSDGSIAAAGNIHGFNLGLTGDSDRALGTAPTGGDRNVVARIRNTGSSNIVTFNITFDIEVWRSHNTSNFIETITNYVSYDSGATWIPTLLDVQTPPDVTNAAPATAQDGNQATNRVAGITGTLTPPTPVAPGSVIYIRWNNFNDSGTDGAMAVDNFVFEATAFSAAEFFVNITSPTSGQNVSGGCAGLANITATANASFTVTNVRFTLDGGTFVDDATPPFSANFPSVAVGLHSIVALATDSTGSTSSTSVFNVVANSAPVINYTNTYSLGVTGLTFEVGSPVTNQFSVVDADGTLAHIQFEVNGLTIYSNSANYGQIIVNNLLLGTNTFTVRATDNCGAVSTSSREIIGTAPAAPISIILTNGALWKYSDAGAQPANDGEGDLWYAVNYDDSAWASGYAELGAGDTVAPPNTTPERTVINIGTTPRHSAVYFRTTFNVSSPSQFGGLIVRSLHDDGAAVYLNGTLVASFNMTNEVGVPFAYTDLAGNAVPDDGTRYYSSNIVNSLVPGVNTIAVEVHQNSTTSSDLSFDLMLWGTPVGGPSLTITQISPTQAEVAWPDSVPGTVQLYSTTDLNAPVTWTAVGGTPTQSGGFYRQIVNTTGNTFFTLRQ